MVLFVPSAPGLGCFDAPGSGRLAAAAACQAGRALVRLLLASLLPPPPGGLAEGGDSVSETRNPEPWGDHSVLPVAVVVGRRAGAPAAAWQVTGVVVGARFASERIRCQALRTGPEGELRMWLGHRLRLHPAQLDDYALNINSPAPTVFVVTEEDAEQGLRPLEVTVSQGEAQKMDATDLREIDHSVAKVAMPPEVYRWLEHYVLEHYVPRRRKARGKRRSKASYDAEVGDYAEDGL